MNVPSYIVSFVILCAIIIANILVYSAVSSLMTYSQYLPVALIISHIIVNVIAILAIISTLNYIKTQ